MTVSTSLTITRLPADFDRWEELLALITEAFASMDGAIDPPSSAKGLTVESLATKAEQEICFIAMRGDTILGCVFATEQQDCLYIGKLAVTPTLQGLGIGRKLVEAAEAYARTSKKLALELQTRIELVRNHAAFARLGFHETARTAHPGYNRPTSITMRKTL